MSSETEKVKLSVEEIVAKDIKKEEAVIIETKKTVAGVIKSLNNLMFKKVR